MSESIYKSHNVSVLPYHVALPAKYRRAVFDERGDEVLKEVCLEIEPRDQVKFFEIGTHKNPVHFLVRSVPAYSATRSVTMHKSLAAREVLKRYPHVKRRRCGVENSEAMGTRQVFRGHSRQTGRRADDGLIRQKSRQGIQQVPFRSSTRIVLSYPAACNGVAHSKLKFWRRQMMIFGRQFSAARAILASSVALVVLVMLGTLKSAYAQVIQTSGDVPEKAASSVVGSTNTPATASVVAIAAVSDATSVDYCKGYSLGAHNDYIFHWQEDYGYLSSPAFLDDLFDPLKYIPLLPDGKAG